MPINEYITSEIFHYFLVFCRVGTCFMLLPGFGDSYVSPRIRLIFALLLSMAIFKIAPNLPQMTGQSTTMLFYAFHEIIIGLMIGGIIKIMTSAVHVAGVVIGMQSSLGQASMFDPNQQSQGAVFGGFLQLLSLVLIFSLDFHHMMIGGIISSYDIFSPSAPLPWGDFSDLALKTLSASFYIGIQMAAPLIVTGVLINVTSGILARLMPAFQVFFVIMPLQIMCALFVFMITLSSIMLIYMNFLDSYLINVFPQK